MAKLRSDRWLIAGFTQELLIRSIREVPRAFAYSLMSPNTNLQRLGEELIYEQKWHIGHRVPQTGYCIYLLIAIRILTQHLPFDRHVVS